MKIISKTEYGLKVFGQHKKRISIPYIKFDFLFLTIWGDLNDDSVNEWRIFGKKI